MRSIAIALVFVFGCSAGATAQIWQRLTNPRVTVDLEHPPGLGLKVTRVAFGPLANPTDCSDQFLDAVIQDFVGSGAEVIDRQHLQQMLDEHKFQLSQYVDQATAARLGKIVGSGVLVFVKIQRCATETDRLHEDGSNLKGEPVRKYISRTSAYIKGSIQAVDLATGRIFAAKVFDAAPKQQNESVGSCCPEFPSQYDVLDSAQRNAVGQIHRLFFAWREPRELYFYDDKDCDLKRAFGLLKAGDVDTTLKMSAENLTACREKPGIKPKAVAHAYYNVGMSHFLKSEYDQAIENLTEAAKLDGGDIITEALAEARNAKQLAAEMARVEAKAAIEAAALQQAAQAAEARAQADKAAASATPRPPTTSKAPSPKPSARSSASSKPASDQSGAEARLAKLNDLYKKGLITKADYDAKKAEILKGF